MNLIEEARAFLKEPFTQQQLPEYFRIMEPLMSERVKLHRDLLEAREKLRMPKDKEYTDFDRKTMNEASCAEIQYNYELVKGLEELVREKKEFYD